MPFPPDMGEKILSFKFLSQIRCICIYRMWRQLHTDRKFLADSAACDSWLMRLYCTAVCDVKFSQKERKCRKLVFFQFIFQQCIAGQGQVVMICFLYFSHKINFIWRSRVFEILNLHCFYPDFFLLVVLLKFIPFQSNQSD